MKSNYSSALHPIEDTEYNGDAMGWITNLIERRVWPSEETWSEEISTLTRNIKRDGSSCGPAGIQAKEALESRARTLQKLLSEYDPLYTLGHMAQQATIGIGNHVDWYSIHGIHALVQYAAGIAYAKSEASGQLPKPPDDYIQEAFESVAEIFALDSFIVQYSQDQSQPEQEHIARAQNLLRVEGLTDRWQGFTQHLTVITRQTFARIDEAVNSELGWTPEEIPELTVAITRILQERLNHFQSTARRNHRQERVAGRLHGTEVTREFLQDHNEFSKKLFTISTPHLAETLSWPEDKTRRALNDLSLIPGSQPNFLLPSQDNLARTYSIVSLGDDSFFAWLPGALIQESHTWFYDLLQRRGLESLSTKYLAARDAATEELTRESLTHVFGADRTHGNASYPARVTRKVVCAG